ncbi:hypothetical protein EVAR_39966_1 [Eumeta japonica]|uniref:Uncharacterized protein n=1 Tax=Eumeta variegata TaxID=151549 RepID=A0A4C1X0R3_EUMVA|nr:hypothetical protein EVAR_39966_1 [Eumeta japonica]
MYHARTPTSAFMVPHKISSDAVTEQIIDSKVGSAGAFVRRRKTSEAFGRVRLFPSVSRVKGVPIRCREPRRSLGYDRESVYRAYVALMRCTGTAAPGAYRTPKCPTRRAPTTLRTAGRLPGHPRRRGHRLTDACVAEPCLPPRPRQPPLRNPVPPPPAAERMRNDARARGWPGVGTGLKIEDRSKKEEGRRRWVIGKRRRGEGRGSLTRTALAAAVRRVDSLISGRQARSVRSTPTRVTDACRLDPVGVHQRPTTGGRLRVRPVPRLPPALGHYLFTTRCPPPDAERMRGDARRGWSSVGTGSTPRQGLERKEEVEGHGSLTRTALAAAVRRVDSLISGRQARSVRSTPTRVTDACRLDPVGVHQRPTTGGRLRVQLELCLPPSSSTNLRRSPSTCRRLRNDRARPRVGRRLGSGKMSINGSKNGPLPPEPSGSYPRREDARA